MIRSLKPARIDWPALRDQIDLSAVATDLLGPPPGRGGRGLWWRCPLVLQLYLIRRDVTAAIKSPTEGHHGRYCNRRQP
jgi:hypothetical protein